MRVGTELIDIAKRIADTSSPRDRLRWEYAHTNDGQAIVIVPSSAPTALYRGQNARHQPCLPSIVRGFSSLGRDLGDLCGRDQLLLVSRLAKGRWFERALDDHPAAQWARGQGLRLHRPALAQHYGIPTGYVDLTESFDVAAFFATCYFDAAASAWRACEVGQGILYRIPWKFSSTGNRINWIGLQPLPRPAEQWAWTLELSLGEDFEQFPNLQSLPFAHAREAGEFFLAKFRGGDELFPSDPMAQVAERIDAAKVIPIDILAETIEDLMTDPQGLNRLDEARIRRALEVELGIRAVADCPPLMTETDVTELASIWEARSAEFLNGVGFRMVRTLKADPNAV